MNKTVYFCSTLVLFNLSVALILQNNSSLVAALICAFLGFLAYENPNR